MRTLRLISQITLAGLLVLGLPQMASAQKSRPLAAPDEPRFEFGGGVGGSFTTQRTITGSSGSADLSFPAKVMGSVWIGHNMYKMVSGELRYDYEGGEYKLSGKGGIATFRSRNQSIHYDVHVHFAPLGSRVRPYVLLGAGVRRFQGNGTERALQANSNIAAFANTSDLKALMTFGAGVKVKLTHSLSLRVEFRDSLTPFPAKVVLPVSGSGPGSLVHDFTPLVGISYIF